MIPVRCHQCNLHMVSSSYILTRRHLQDKAQDTVSWDRCHIISTVTLSHLRRCRHNITGWALTPRVPALIHRLLASLSLLRTTHSKWYMWRHTHGPPTLRQGLLPHPILALLLFHTLIHHSIRIRQHLPHSMADSMSQHTFTRWDPCTHRLRGSSLSSSQHTLSAWGRCRRTMTSAFA